jgi:ABC-type uncharacterized transport system permease subunit
MFNLAAATLPDPVVCHHRMRISLASLSRYITHLLKIDPLLSGIIVLTMLFTVYLRVMGTSNLPLFDASTLFLKDRLHFLNYVIALGFVAIPILGLLAYLHTHHGLVFQAIRREPNFM